MKSKLLTTINENCGGYYCPYPFNFDELFDFGQEDITKILPVIYLASIQPVTTFQSILHGIHAYRENSWNCTNERQRRTQNKWTDKNLQNLIIYNVPLDTKQLIKKFAKHKELEDFFKDKLPLEPPQTSIAEYTDALNETFSNPYFIHIRGYIPRGTETDPRRGANFDGRGHSFVFFVVGEKEHTSELSDYLLDKPQDIEEVITGLTGIEQRRLIDAFRRQNKLIHFDATKRWKKKTVKKITKHQQE